TRVMRIVDHEVRFRDAVAELDDFDVAVGLAADALVAIFAEDQRLAMFELDDVFAASVLFRDAGPGAVIKDVAVLQDLDEGGAMMRGSLLESFFQVGLEDVDGAGDEGGFGTDGEGDWIERAIERAVRRGLCFFANFRRRRILALGEAVD